MLTLKKQPARVVASVDWGFTNPGVIQVWALDGDGRMYLIAERYETKQLIEKWIEYAKEFQGFYHPEVFVCDPSEPAYIEQMRRANIPAQPATNAVAPGIQAVQSRFAKAKDGKPRIMLVEGALVKRDELLAEKRKPTCTLDEIESYVWPKDSSGRPKKEEPVKVDDHGCDAMRYAVTYVDRGHVDGHVSVVYPRATATRPTAARKRYFL